jgi:hypothetical protein
MSTTAPKVTQKKRATAHKPAAAPRETTPLRVRALRTGYWNEMRRREGDVFVMQIAVTNGEAELPSWVALAERSAAIKETGAQAALNVVTENARAMREGATPAVTASSGDDLGI